MTTETAAMRFFQVGKIRAEASHAWRTHPMASGSRRFTWIYRLCRIIADDGGESVTIRLTGLRSRPTRVVPRAEVVSLAGVDTKTLPLSA